MKKSVLKSVIQHKHYKNVLKANNLYYTKMRRFESKLHKVHTVELNKLVYTPFDDKRYLLDNGSDSLPFGHYQIDNL